jgi:hypothetical protein
MGATCSVDECGVVAIGRCFTCGNAFCRSHQALTVEGTFIVDQCRPCRLNKQTRDHSERQRAAQAVDEARRFVVEDAPKLLRDRGGKSISVHVKERVWPYDREELERTFASGKGDVSVERRFLGLRFELWIGLSATHLLFEETVTSGNRRYVVYSRFPGKGADIVTFGRGWLIGTFRTSTLSGDNLRKYATSEVVLLDGDLRSPTGRLAPGKDTLGLVSVRRSDEHGGYQVVEGVFADEWATVAEAIRRLTT